MNPASLPLSGLDAAHAAEVLRRGNEGMGRASMSPFLDAITREELHDFTAVLHGVNDVQTVGVVFLVGRDHLRTGELREDAPAKRSRASLVEWAKKGPPAVVTWTLTGMIATRSVSLLETFFAARDDSGKLTARGGKNFGVWLRRLEQRGCAIDDAVASVVRCMIDERNRFVHEAQPALDAGYIDRAATAIAAFPYSVLLCARAFLESPLRST